MAPVILSITPRGDGTSVAVVSVAPGRRAQLVVWSQGIDELALRGTLLALVETIERKGTR